MIERLPTSSLAPVDPADDGDIDWPAVMAGCPRMPELPPVRKLEGLDRRLNLYVSVGGRCSSCPAFLAVDTMVPMWLDNERVRLGAVCRRCANKVGRST